LERLGLPRCPGEVSAANPRWCQPVTVWRRYFSEWVNHPQPQALLNCAIFFDLRPIVGHHELAEQLWSDLERWLPRATFFTKMLLRESLVHRPPLGLFGRLTVEKAGPHAGAFDLKWRGVMPIIEPARVYALAHGLRLTNTVERLRTLASLGELSHTDGDDLAEAYQFLMRLRLQHHLEQASSGQEPDDFIVPAQLPAEQRETLRRHFKIVARLQEFVEHQVLAGLVR
jgi:CBS domain-containing protein